MTKLRIREIHFIEDSDDEVFLARMLLENQNVEQAIVHHTDLKSFSETIETVDTLCPIIVIVDLNLPGMKGDEIVRRIGEATTDKNIIVGICTGSDDPADMLRAREVGAHFYVPKPLDLRCLNRICNANSSLAMQTTSHDRVGMFANPSSEQTIDCHIH